jgi:DnaK suppressor protein
MDGSRDGNRDGKTLAQIRDLLLARWRQLGKAAQEERERGLRTASDEAEIHTPPTELIDVAQSLEQLGRDASLKEQERRELLAIERALAKMSTGSFGICEDCAEEIPCKRLMVLPEARLCANCQAFEEKQNSRMRTFRATG